MKKRFLQVATSFTLLLLTATTANSQLGIVKRPKLALGVNFIYAMPQGEFKDHYQYGIGGELYGGVGVGSTYLLASVGITGYKPPSGFSNTLSTVPVKAGLKKYFLLKKLFINGDIGVATIKLNGASAGSFTTGVGAGVRLLGMEASVYYNAFKNNGVYSSTGYSNSLNAKIGWGIAL